MDNNSPYHRWTCAWRALYNTIHFTATKTRYLHWNTKIFFLVFFSLVHNFSFNFLVMVVLLLLAGFGIKKLFFIFYFIFLMHTLRCFNEKVQSKWCWGFFLMFFLFLFRRQSGKKENCWTKNFSSLYFFSYTPYSYFNSILAVRKDNFFFIFTPLLY